jgi:uncharacterized protein
MITKRKAAEAQRTRLIWILCVSVALRSVIVGAEDTRVADAAKRQDAAVVRALIGQRADVNVPQADGTTALHWAAHWNDAEMVDALLRAGARPNALNDLGVSPLFLACTNASAPIVARLLQGGADPNLAGARVPALLECARTGSAEAVKALLDRKADVNAKEPVRDQTALMWAVANGHPDVVRLLITRGADVGARSRVVRAVVNRANPNDITAASVGEVSVSGGTALLFAARRGDVQSAELLLAAGAGVDELMADGTSALTIAVHSGHRAMALFLLNRGATPNVIGSGYTALHAAVLRGDPDVVNALIAKGALINSRVRHGTTTIRASREYFLSDALAGATPLLLAGKFLEVEIMQALIGRGADTRATLNDGTTLLMLAAGTGSQPKLFDRRERIAVLKETDEPRALEAVKLALDRGADVNAANQTGETALHAAARMNYPRVAALLMERGAHATTRNKKGETPVMLAGGEAVKDALRRASP